MLSDNIFEISVIDVFDRGKPNLERIGFRIFFETDMGQFGLLLGVRSADGGATPVNDNYFWFGSGKVYRDDLLYVYTGPGVPATSKIPNTDRNIYSVHWGRKKTCLNHPDILPILIRMNGVRVINDTRRENLQLPE